MWTRDVISFLKPDEETLIDAIPLAEVKSVKAMNAAEPAPPNETSQSKLLKAMPSFNPEIEQTPPKRKGEPDKDQPGSERASKAADRAATKVSDSNKTKFQHALQVGTLEAGHNAGRAYYIQANSAEQCQQIVDSLQRLAKAARKRAEALSMFRRAQVHNPPPPHHHPPQSSPARRGLCPPFNSLSHRCGRPGQC